MNKKHVIIGVSAAGISMANNLRRLDSESEIICISTEKEIPYNKCFLADHLSGLKSEDQVYTLTPDLCKKKNITLRLGVWVERIVSQEKKIIISGGESISYDTLFIGTGSFPVVPDIKGVKKVKNGIFTFHTIADSQALLSLAKSKKGLRVVIVGAGLSGLECADSLSEQGAHVFVVEMHNRVLFRQVDQQGSDLIVKHMLKQGISFYPEQTVSEVLSDQKRTVSGVKLASGLQLEADCVVFALGLRPNIGIVKGTDIELCNGGILTDDYMRTTVPNIYAGGDVACVKDQVSGERVLSCTWPDAMFQGMIAANAVTGKPRIYPGVTLITSSSFFGLTFCASGATAGPVVSGSNGYEIAKNASEDNYCKILVKNGLVRGFLSVGASTNLARLKRALLSAQPIDIDQLLV